MKKTIQAIQGRVPFCFTEFTLMTPCIIRVIEVYPFLYANTNGVRCENAISHMIHCMRSFLAYRA